MVKYMTTIESLRLPMTQFVTTEFLIIKEANTRINF